MCWKPEPISAYAAQMLSKCATNPEHLGDTGFTAHARRDCRAHVRLVPCLPGALALLSACLRAELCWHGACIQDFQMSSSSSIPQGSVKTSNIFRLYQGQSIWVKRQMGLSHCTQVGRDQSAKPFVSQHHEHTLDVSSLRSTGKARALGTCSIQEKWDALKSELLPCLLLTKHKMSPRIKRGETK